MDGTFQTQQKSDLFLRRSFILILQLIKLCLMCAKKRSCNNVYSILWYATIDPCTTLLHAWHFLHLGIWDHSCGWLEELSERVGSFGLPPKKSPVSFKLCTTCSSVHCAPVSVPYPNQTTDKSTKAERSINSGHRIQLSSQKSSPSNPDTWLITARKVTGLHPNMNREDGFLTRPTNAQHIFINNISYFVSTHTCFNASKHVGALTIYVILLIYI